MSRTMSIGRIACGQGDLTDDSAPQVRVSRSASSGESGRSFDGSQPSERDDMPIGERKYTPQVDGHKTIYQIQYLQNGRMIRDIIACLQLSNHGLPVSFFSFDAVRVDSGISLHGHTTIRALPQPVFH